MCNFIFNKIGGYIICIETSSETRKKTEGPHGNPQFLFHFPVEQLLVLVLCTWVEYSDIGIIFGISSKVNSKLFIQISMGTIYNDH